MSDSEDSDCFLSADSGDECGERGASSSDVTLSSDSERGPSPDPIQRAAHQSTDTSSDHHTPPSASSAAVSAESPCSGASLLRTVPVSGVSAVSDSCHGDRVQSDHSTARASQVTEHIQCSAAVPVSSVSGCSSSLAALPQRSSSSTCPSSTLSSSHSTSAESLDTSLSPLPSAPVSSIQATPIVSSAPCSTSMHSSAVDPDRCQSKPTTAGTVIQDGRDVNKTETLTTQAMSDSVRSKSPASSKSTMATLAEGERRSLDESQPLASQQRLAHSSISPHLSKPSPPPPTSTTPQPLAKPSAVVDQWDDEWPDFDEEPPDPPGGTADNYSTTSAQTGVETRTGDRSISSTTAAGDGDDYDIRVVELENEKTSSRLQQKTNAATSADTENWGAWESWGSSLLTSARHVTRSVMDTVEAGLDSIPQPEQLARQQQQQQQELEQRGNQKELEISREHFYQDGSSWLGGVSRVLGETSSMVVGTGLDTLELIGKRTMDALQSRPDQLTSIRDKVSQLALKQQQPSLAQTLRELQEQSIHGRSSDSDLLPAAAKHQQQQQLAPTFHSLFDKSDGSVHSEALQMIAEDCSRRVALWRSSYNCDEHAAIDDALHSVQRMCCPEELDDSANIDNFDAELKFIVSKFKLSLSPSGISIAQSSWRGVLEQLVNNGRLTPEESRARLLHCCVQMASGLTAFFHKLATLWLSSTPAGSRAGSIPFSQVIASALAQLVSLMAAEVAAAAASHAEPLVHLAGQEASDACTDIFLEASRCREHLLNVLNMMTFVVQVVFVLGNKTSSIE